MSDEASESKSALKVGDAVSDSPAVLVSTTQHEDAEAVHSASSEQAGVAAKGTGQQDEGVVEDSKGDNSTSAGKTGLLARTADSSSSPEPQDEGLSRKRDREGSVEPGRTASASSKPRSSDVLPAKKNRLAGTAEEGSDRAHSPDPKAPLSLPADSEKVGQIRQRVEELSHDERRTKRTATGERISEDSVPNTETIKASVEDGADSTQAPPLPPRPDTSESVKEGVEGVSHTKPQSSVLSATSPRTQPTFSSFSSSASPFASSSAKSGVSGPSWLAGSSSSTVSSSSASPLLPKSSSPFAASGGMSGTTGAIRPSSLGGSETSSQGENAQRSAQAPKAAMSKSSGLGFGAFTGSRPFTAGASANASSASTPASADDKDGEGLKAGDKPGGSIFDRDSKAKGARMADAGTNTIEGEEKESPDQSSAEPKVQKMAQQELTTGEEDERTKHSVRAKLYSMVKADDSAKVAADSNWRERGTGTLRLNVSKKTSVQTKAAPRLVMRAEGVFRLILNVALFPGMKVEIAQDKFVRFVALENEKLVHFALRVSSASAAANLSEAVEDLIPRS